jgi:hypothetical protein
MKSWKLFVVAVLSIAAAPTSARAQSSTAQAETLFRQGKDLIAQGKLAEACAAFDASQKLDPTIATLLNQASCREKNGQLATAWGLFLDAERQSRSATDDAGRKLHRVATDHASKLERRLSTLTITVPLENRVRGLEILRNNEAVDPGAWNKALPVDGGTYTITARAPGNAEWSSSVTVAAERDSKSIETPKLKAAALSSTARPAGSTPAPAVRGRTTPTARRSLVVPLVLGGAALALGGGALGFELSARATNDKAVDEQDDARQTSLWESANTKRHVAQGFGVASVACAGVAVWLYLRGGSESETTSTSVQAQRLLVQPIVGTDQAGLVLTGAF